MYPTEKDIESYYLKLLRQSIGTFPNGVVISNESPDFILNTDTGKIGIEITKVYKSVDSLGKHPQVQENECNLLVAEALSVYEKMGLPIVEVVFHFNHHTLFSKKNRSQFANKIALIVATNIPADKSWKMVVNDLKNPNYYPYEIDSISIARYGHTTNHWSKSGGGLVQEDFIPELQNAISKKNQKVLKFDKDCNCHWLIVVIEGMDDSTLFEPSEATLNNTYESKFDKIYLLNRFGAKGYELKIISAA